MTIGTMKALPRGDPLTESPYQPPGPTWGLSQHSDRERFHSGKLARHVECIHLQILENGTGGNALAPIQGSKLTRGDHNRQTRVLADAEHQLAVLREQKVRVPVAEDRGRSSRMRHDRSAQPPQELLRATESDHVDARLRAVGRRILPT